MKICCSCKKKKYESDFNKNKIKKDGLNGICRKCSNERSRRYYIYNKKNHRKSVRIRNIKIRKRNQQFIVDILLNSKCADCGISDIRVFEFDHCSGKKFKDISVMIAYSNIEDLKKEIKKCDIVCANCHRIRTYKRNPSYKSIAWKASKKNGKGID